MCFVLQYFVWHISEFIVLRNVYVLQFKMILDNPVVLGCSLSHLTDYLELTRLQIGIGANRHCCR